MKGVLLLSYPKIEETISLIKELVSIPSPSGNTKEVISFVENFFNELNIHI